MSAFVKLRLDDGREVVYPIADIEEVLEVTPAYATKHAKTGCVAATIRGGDRTVWIIGTVDQVLAAIRDAEKEGTK